MWQYRVTTSPGCRTSTYQPQPPTVAEPSTSQLLVEALHSAVTTVPANAARIGVPRRAPRSSPSCAGRDGGRKPPQIGALTGLTQPVAGTVWTGAGGGGGQATGAVPVRRTYPSETYLPSASLSHAVVVRTTPVTREPFCWHRIVRRPLFATV